MRGMMNPPIFLLEMNEQSVPKHIAIIMDGNGRWAERRGLERVKGHLEGMQRVGEIVNVADEMGIRFLTLYTFSKENWKRPKAEVAVLMQMICLGLEKKTDDLIKKGIRFHFIGDTEGVPQNILDRLIATKNATAKGGGLQVNMAFNYSSRFEIVQAIKEAARQVRDGEVEIDGINEEFFSGLLYTHDIPDPDLLIRTSGEKRISNFLLWQLSYTEMYFTELFWPDFTTEEFRKAIENYRQRERRFGDIQSTR